jgi:uncharacterized membrane protein SirB2
LVVVLYVKLDKKSAVGLAIGVGMFVTKTIMLENSTTVMASMRIVPMISDTPLLSDHFFLNFIRGLITTSTDLERYLSDAGLIYRREDI